MYPINIYPVGLPFVLRLSIYALSSKYIELPNKFNSVSGMKNLK